MTELEKRLHRCCFTGHRPEKLNSTEEEIKKALLVEINNAIHDGYITFISGMARGVDIWAAELILELQDIEDGFVRVLARVETNHVLLQQLGPV